MRDTSEYKDSKFERRKFYFLGTSLVGLVMLAIFSGLVFVPLMIAGYMSIGWGIFFICYGLAIIIIDFIWFSNQYSVSRIKRSLRRIYRRKDKRYYIARRKRRERIRELVVKDPAQRNLYKDLFTKKMYILSLFLGAFIFLAIWGIVELGAVVGGILIIVGVIILIFVTLWDVFYEIGKVREIREESMAKKRRELRRFQQYHPD